MNTRDLTDTLATLLGELVDGPPGAAYMLNQGDPGLLRSLDKLTAADASAAVQGGATVAAHVDHLRYGLSLMNRWSGGDNPFAGADWSASWRKTSVSDGEWQELRTELASEAHRWLEALRKPRRSQCDRAEWDRRQHCPPGISPRRHSSDPPGSPRSRRRGVMHMNQRTAPVRRYATVLMLALSATVLAAQSAMPPEPERTLAREIYKEMVEIKSGYTTGATTPVAEAVARRLKAAGFPDADIFVGGAIPTKANLVVRYRGTGRSRPAAAARTHRRRRGKARRLDHGSVHADRARRVFLRTRHRATTRHRPRSGLRTSFATSAKASSRTATSSWRSPQTKKGAGPTTASSWLLKNKREYDRRRVVSTKADGANRSTGGASSNDVQLSEKYIINYRLEVTTREGQLAPGRRQRHLPPGGGARTAPPGSPFR